MKNVKDLIAVKKPPTEVWVSAVDIFFNKRTREDFINYWKGLADHVQIAPYVRYPEISDWRLPRKKMNCSKTCQRLETDMVILSSGKVAKCCIDFAGATTFGDSNYQTLEKIWNGQKRNDFIEKMRSRGRKRLRPCNICVI